MSDLVHVKGLSELQRFLDQLPGKTTPIVRSGLRAAANVVRAAAQANVPVESGDLRDSLDAKRGLSTSSRGGIIIAKARTKVFYAKFVEYGTRPHTISARDGGFLQFGSTFRRSVEHPGIVNPRPFMRPALDENAQAAVIAAGEQIKKRLTKAGIDASEVLLEGDEE